MDLESGIANWLRWPSVETFLSNNSWAWPLMEVFHVVGLILLVGIVAMFDLRLIGVARRLPIKPLRDLLPWAVFGLILCVFSGLVFVAGLMNNVAMHPYVALQVDLYLQIKLLFIALAGINLLVFHQSGVSRLCDEVGPGDDAPPMAKAIGGISLFLWVGVVYWGRLVPWGI